MKDPHEHCERTSPVPGEEEKHHKDNVNMGPADSSRRSFVGKVGIGSAAAVALAAGIPLEPLFEGKHGEAEASVVPYGPAGRGSASFNYRKNTAGQDLAPPPRNAGQW